jgi:hypothetical protein
MAVFRIIFGAFLLFYFALQLPHVAMLYSREGLLMPLLDPTHWSTVIFTPLPAWAAYILFCVFLGTLLTFTIGLYTNGSALLIVLFYIYYWIISLFQFATSFDRLFLFTMIVLTFSGCGKTFSADMRIRCGSWVAWQPISILPQRLLSIQIMMTYLGVGWQKLMLPAWQSGEVLAWGFVGRWATPPAWWIARLNISLWWYDRMVWAIKAFECTIPFGLWSKKYRWWFFLGGALFHIGIAILLAIWWFVALIPAYILFFTPEEIEGWLRSVSLQMKKLS